MLFMINEFDTLYIAKDIFEHDHFTCRNCNIFSSSFGLRTML